MRRFVSGGLSVALFCLVADPAWSQEVSEPSPDVLRQQPSDIAKVEAGELDGEASGDLLRPAQMGNLQRVVASLETTLNTYRLALGEGVLAAGLIAKLGDEPGSRPERGLPEKVHAVFLRLARVVSSRVPASALAPIPRGYHFEALDAWEKLAEAKTFAQLVQPLTDLERSVRRLTHVADHVVDLFSRQRPIQVEIFDADVALEQISDALEAVGEAERRILALRQQGADLAEQFQAFLLLEISLGNALDLIAAAEEAGISVGFELQLALETFRSVLEHLKLRVDQLAELVEAMKSAPAASLRDFEAWVESDGRVQRLQLKWMARGSRDPAAWRVEMGSDANRSRLDALEDARCHGISLAEAEGELDEPGAASTGEFKVIEVAGGDLRELTVELDKPLLAPGSESARDGGAVVASAVGSEGRQWPNAVRVSPLNSFGVAGRGQLQPLVVVGDEPVGVSHLCASVPRVTPFDDDFYRAHDRVEIRWRPSLWEALPNDAAELGRVVGYEVFRGEESVATLGVGSASFSDRPPLDLLAAGIRYRVVTLLDDGRRAESVSCDGCAEVAVDRRPARVLAESGARYFDRPSAIEIEATAQILEDRVKRNVLWEEFTALSVEVQDRDLASWWSALRVDERSDFLASWVELHGGVESPWFKTSDFELAEHDRNWVLAALWLEEQDDVIRGEVARSWDFLTPEAGRRHERAWLETRSDAWQRAFAEALDGKDDPELRKRLTQPARIDFWVSTKDPQEFALIETWWDELDDGGRKLRLSRWLERQPAVWASELRWPPEEILSDGEREARVARAYRDLPEALRARFLAWWSFERLGDDALLAAVRSEVSWLLRSVERLVYAFRPWDRAMGFSGIWLLVAYVVGFVAISRWLWTRRSRRIRRVIAPPNPS